ncbi:hypothetical protein RRG08_047629 [Elysia crispata]|uniref:Fibrinogen C-terminal domain-containing protein n=1 Tax=Elysia crispata TaxID=231223 RepID=A0AAE1BFV9_9GAST|nr:hypothetical protein RRG08_047629 [Elysia crispata]
MSTPTTGAAGFIVFLLMLISVRLVVSISEGDILDVSETLKDLKIRDLSSSVSKLEDRIFALLLLRPAGGEKTGLERQTRQGLEERVQALEEFMQAVNQREGPRVCERGMGNNVTTQYPPYLILSDSTIEKDILCDTHTDGGGWIIIQRRTKGDVDFYRDWAAYREGFGSLTGDFWFGNDAIHNLTTQGAHEVRVDLRIDGQEVFAYSTRFLVRNEGNAYRMSLGSTSGTAGALGLWFSNDMKFSTFDRDNDPLPDFNCAKHHQGAGWFAKCHKNNINGIWGEKSSNGVSWSDGRSWKFPNFTEMKIRRVNSQI